jgi:hypothetical protein
MYCLTYSRNRASGTRRPRSVGSARKHENAPSASAARKVARVYSSACSQSCLNIIKSSRRNSKDWLIDGVPSFFEVRRVGGPTSGRADGERRACSLCSSSVLAGTSISDSTLNTSVAYCSPRSRDALSRSRIASRFCFKYSGPDPAGSPASTAAANAGSTTLADERRPRPPILKGR